MTAALGVGGLIGALGAMALGGQRLAVPFGISLVFWGLPIALMGPLPELPFALLMLAVVGAANSVEDVAAFTLLQRLIPDRILTRVFGVVWSLAMGGVALGSVVAPALVEAIGAREAFIGVGAILPLLTVATYRKLRASTETRPRARVGVRPTGSHVSAPFDRGEGASGRKPASAVGARGRRRDPRRRTWGPLLHRGNGALEITARVCVRSPMRATTSARSLCSETCPEPRQSRRSRTVPVRAATRRFPRSSHRARSRARLVTRWSRSGCRGRPEGSATASVR